MPFDFNQRSKVLTMHYFLSAIYLMYATNRPGSFCVASDALCME